MQQLNISATVENERKSAIQKLTMSGEPRNKLFRLQSGGAGEYTSSDFEKYLQSEGIQHYVTNADEARQNGLSERYGRSLQEAGLSMLKHSNLPERFWSFAMKSAARILYSLSSKALEGHSPHEIRFNEIPNIFNLRIWGCDAWVRDPKRSKGKDKVK